MTSTSSPSSTGASTRAELLTQLLASAASLAASGDIEAARLAHETAGKLLGSPSAAAPVVDLAQHRKRGGR